MNGGPAVEVYISPGTACLQAIQGKLARTKATADLCVFTITDDRITDAILQAHQRGVRARVITDNDKAQGEGSDIDRMAAAGLAVRVDRTPFHMHHKYAVLDGKLLLNGSFNWTRGAPANNEENLMVANDPELLASFIRHFEDLWDKLG